jgi:hypothetical protein
MIIISRFSQALISIGVATQPFGSIRTTTVSFRPKAVLAAHHFPVLDHALYHLG